MIENENLQSRHTVPRWRSISSALSAGELSSLNPRGLSKSQELFKASAQAKIEAEFIKKKKAWDSTNDSALAEELICAAIVAGKTSDPSVLTAAIRVQMDNYHRPALQGFAERIIHGPHPHAYTPVADEIGAMRKEVSLRKKLINLNPRDSWLLTETALIYANLGQSGKSRHFLLRALKTTPNDRYVLRSAARFFVHVGEPDFAEQVLARSPRSNVDPWLMSARLATEGASGKQSNAWKGAKSLLANENFSSFDRSELAAEVGTMELKGGSRRRAVRFLRQGAENPTENAVAQIEWVSSKSRILETTELLANLSFSDEATAHRAYFESDWQTALSAAERWLQLEPFSARPAVFGTFVASILSHSIDRGLAIARRGLRCNPRDLTLLNNAIVLLCYANRIAEAKVEYGRLSEISHSQTDSIVRLATGGLISFREANYDQGIEQYRRAIDEAIKLREASFALRAYCFLAREVTLLDSRVAGVFSKNITEVVNVFRKRNVFVPKEVEILLDQIKLAAGVRSSLDWGDLSRFDLARQIEKMDT